MKTIKEDIEKIIYIKKSKFIGEVFFINSIDEVSNILEKIRLKHPQATHICYAYIIDNNIKYSDDNEPSKTAGLPIYNILKKNNLNHVLLVVIRYFGGIKLGANGLIRAYSNIARECINNNLCDEIKGYLISISFNYEDSKQVDYLLNNYTIIDKNYKDRILYSFIIPDEDLEMIENKLKTIVTEFRITHTCITKNI